VRRIVIWLAAALLSMALTVIVFFPAAWLAPAVEAQTGGRLTLGDAHGTLWRGSAFIGGAPGAHEPVTPLLPGRFNWQLSPLLLLGQVDAELHNQEALSQPVRITGSWWQWLVGSAEVIVPAERLAALGAPLNTIQPAGRMRLSWSPLQLTRRAGRVEVQGTMTLQMDEVSSRLSPVKPLGAYRVRMDWRGQQAQVALTTVKGPMLLSGNGTLINGRLQFSGKAEAEAGQEERLANLLNLLGLRRKEGDKDVIALEIK
jgi:general secretion pathway protein N